MKVLNITVASGKIRERRSRDTSNGSTFITNDLYKTKIQLFEGYREDLRVIFERRHLLVVQRRALFNDQMCLLSVV